MRTEKGNISEELIFLFLPKEAECSPDSRQGWCYLGASWPKFWGCSISQKSGHGTKNEVGIRARKYPS